MVTFSQVREWTEDLLKKRKFAVGLRRSSQTGVKIESFEKNLTFKGHRKGADEEGGKLFSPTSSHNDGNNLNFEKIF